MIFDPPHPREAFVWVWLPAAIEPVVAGRLVSDGKRLQFVYGRSYRERAEAISLYWPEMPLGVDPIPPLGNSTMPGAIRDGAPDAWGQRVILNKIFGRKGKDTDVRELDDLVYLLESGSDRIGALDFQSSATAYVPRSGGRARLEDLLVSAEKVESNLPLDPDLDQALFHGSSIGGARPKALITDQSRKYVAKFSSSADTYSIVKSEYIAMRLATIAGLNVAPVRLASAAGKDVLLVERFDRIPSGEGWRRRAVVSALTILGLDEMQARYASYQDLAEIIRSRFVRPDESLRELFARLCFNILVGNLDDHARNHAAFWDGSQLTLTPAYDLCPQARAGEEASQAMLIVDGDRSSRIATCLAAAGHFHLDEVAAIDIVGRQVRILGDHWLETCVEAGLGQVDRALLWGRQFLNPFAFYGLDGNAACLADLATRYRTSVAGRS